MTVRSTMCWNTYTPKKTPQVLPQTEQDGNWDASIDHRWGAGVLGTHALLGVFHCHSLYAKHRLNCGCFHVVMMRVEHKDCPTPQSAPQLDGIKKMHGLWDTQSCME